MYAITELLNHVDQTPKAAGVLTAAELKASLEDRLGVLKCKYEAALKAYRDLNAEFSNIMDAPCYASEAIDKAVTEWVKGLADTASRHYRGDGQASIDGAELKNEWYQAHETDDNPHPFRLNSRNYRSDETIAEAVTRYQAGFNYRILEKLTTEKATELEGKGLAEAAKKLNSFYGLISYYPDQQSAPFKIVKGKVCRINSKIYTEHYGRREYSHDFRRSLMNLLGDVATFETHTGMTGLSEALQQTYDRIDQHASSGGFSAGVLPSRTVVTENTVVTARVFNTKIEWDMPQNMARALLAFVKMYDSRLRTERPDIFRAEAAE